MDPKTLDRLNQLNKSFYQQVGGDFSRTRQSSWNGWDKLVPLLKWLNHGKVRVLDVGCGNGRFGEFLNKSGLGTNEGKWSYVGIDSNEGLLNEAKIKLYQTKMNSQLLQVDITKRDWVKKIGEERFEMIVMFGVLHHIPGFVNRKRLVEILTGLLDLGGVIVVSAWQFDKDARHKLQVTRIKKEALLHLGLVDTDLEENDYFLGWGNRPGIWRYCHLVTRYELETLTEGLAINQISGFEADGKGGNLNLYRVYQRSNSPLRGSVN